MVQFVLESSYNKHYNSELTLCGNFAALSSTTSASIIVALETVFPIIEF